MRFGGPESDTNKNTVWNIEDNNSKVESYYYSKAY